MEDLWFKMGLTHQRIQLKPHFPCQIRQNQLKLQLFVDQYEYLILINWPLMRARQDISSQSKYNSKIRWASLTSWDEKIPFTKPQAIDKITGPFQYIKDMRVPGLPIENSTHTLTREIIAEIPVWPKLSFWSIWNTMKLQLNIERRSQL